MFLSLVLAWSDPRPLCSSDPIRILATDLDPRSHFCSKHPSLFSTNGWLGRFRMHSSFLLTHKLKSDQQCMWPKRRKFLEPMYVLNDIRPEWTNMYIRNKNTFYNWIWWNGEFEWGSAFGGRQSSSDTDRHAEGCVCIQASQFCIFIRSGNGAGLFLLGRRQLIIQTIKKRPSRVNE